MSNNYLNNLVVYGERNDLDKFKQEIAGDYKNGPMSFQNIIPEPDNTKGWENSKFSSSQRWRGYNWGSIFDALWPTLTDEGKSYHYFFQTYMGEVVSIYETLFFKYPNLAFHVNYNNEGNEDTVIIEAIDGEIKKKIYLYWKCKPWKNGKSLDILYENDLINDTKNIVKVNIFRHGEYDDAYHKWVSKPIYDYKNN